MSRGPQAIAQPGGSVLIPYSATAASIQTAINANIGATTFWIEKGGGTGVRAQTAALVPKSGNTFVFEFGAILDGSGWTTSDTTQGAFRAHNENIDTVTIRNGEIRYMPQRGVHVYKDFSQDWIVEDCLIHHCKYGFAMPTGGILRRSILHHCIGNPLSPIAAERGGAYLAFGSIGVTLDDNEISYCGPEQKFVGTGSGSIVKSSYFHHNDTDIWFDTDNDTVQIYDNLCEDSYSSIVYEVSESALIYNNTIRRAAGSAIYIATSKNNEVYTNTIENSFRGLQLFLYPPAVALGYDLADNNIHDNTVVLGTRPGSLCAGFSYDGSPSALFLAPYLTNTKNNLFIDNHYTVPTTGQWWYWPA